MHWQKYELDYFPPKSLYQSGLSPLFLSPMENPKIICKYLTTKKYHLLPVTRSFPGLLSLKMMQLRVTDYRTIKLMLCLYSSQGCVSFPHNYYLMCTSLFHSLNRTVPCGAYLWAPRDSVHFKKKFLPKLLLILNGK